MSDGLSVVALSSFLSSDSFLSPICEGKTKGMLGKEIETSKQHEEEQKRNENHLYNNPLLMTVKVNIEVCFCLQFLVWCHFLDMLS